MHTANGLLQAPPTYGDCRTMPSYVAVAMAVTICTQCVAAWPCSSIVFMRETASDAGRVAQQAVLSFGAVDSSQTMPATQAAKYAA